jgi:tRNA (mo5U34)-methyltransferase
VPENPSRGRPGRMSRVVASLGPWFHNLHLPDGTQTAPAHVLGDFPAYKWQELAAALPSDLRGWRVLDVGCNAGYYSFELARRGARVAGVDVNAKYLAQAEWAAGLYGLKDRVRFHRLQIYELAAVRGVFDLVLFLGVFYHLRYPLLGLDIVARLTGRLMAFQTMLMPGRDVRPAPPDFGMHEREILLDPGWPKLGFIEKRLAGDPTNWWIANQAAAEALLRSSGFRVAACPGTEVFLCEPDPQNPSSVATWNAAEFEAATGVTAPAHQDIEALLPPAST